MPTSPRRSISRRRTSSMTCAARDRHGREELRSLSGGQRQRLALARAVAAVLVLDDPLSALDVDTEALVEAALRRCSPPPPRSSWHRPSTVMLADRVCPARTRTNRRHRSAQQLLESSGHHRFVISSADEASGSERGRRPASPAHPGEGATTSQRPRVVRSGIVRCAC
jgi:ABC-type multidrug transport system ATPase subunit